MHNTTASALRARHASPRARRHLAVSRLAALFRAPACRCTAGIVYHWAACSCGALGCCSTELVNTSYCACRLGQERQERDEAATIEEAGGPPPLPSDPDFPF